MAYFKTIFIFVVIIFFSTSCSSKKESITPEIKNITESVYASGYIQSKNQYEVFSKINGIVEEIYVAEGDQVKKGNPIFRLDNENLKIATENAQLNSNALDYEINANKIKDAQKNIDLAQKKLKNDSLLYERQKKLWSENIGSKVDFEQKELNYENAKVALETAKTNLEDLKRQLKLQSAQSKNNVEIAKIQEEDLIIRSEIDGVVFKINKEKGEQINGAEPAAIIGSNEFIIQLNIDELDVIKIKKGQQVIIRMDSYQSEVFEAEIVAIDPIMNARTRSFEAEAVFTKKPTELFPNLTLEANIVIQTKENVLTIPRNYLVNDSMVYLEGGDLQKVEVGLMDYDLVEIISGIDKNTKIELTK